MLDIIKGIQDKVEGILKGKEHPVSVMVDCIVTSFVLAIFSVLMGGIGMGGGPQDNPGPIPIIGWVGLNIACIIFIACPFVVLRNLKNAKSKMTKIVLVLASGAFLVFSFRVFMSTYL